MIGHIGRIFVLMPLPRLFDGFQAALQIVMVMSQHLVDLLRAQRPQIRQSEFKARTQ
jgi:hypothetical protein